MTQLTPDEKREIVREELHRLVESRYITLNIAAKIVNAHTKYYNNLSRVNQMKQNLEKATQPVVKPQVTITPQKPTEKTEHIQQHTKPVTKQRKKLTDKQLRDRNITWGLSLGVILLLLGGLVYATSTWDTLGNWSKTGLIATVSILFFGLAWFTGRILHIQKTAFSFLVLASLFLPIVIISAGYFSLFGTYLSFSGEGKYLFSAIGTVVLLPIYTYFAMKLSSRLFVWFSYLSLSVLIGLMIAALYLPVDSFYLGIMLYNAALIFAYRQLRVNKKLQQFIHEFIPFIQANLILSTLLMLVFYENELMYSFNLLLTAVIYLSMIFVTKYQSYHFVFTAMLIYGAYQFVENSMIVGISEVAYATLGIVFLVIPKLIKYAGHLQKVFQITSAIVSSLAFLYISFEGIMIRTGEGSIVLVFAYVIIAMNFSYLVSVVKNKLFAYLSPFFIVIALYQLALLGNEWINFESTILPFFMFVMFFYVIGGGLINHAFWKPLKESTRDISGLALLFTILFGTIDSPLLQQGSMILLLSGVAVVMNRYETRVGLQKFAPWIHALSLGTAVAVIARNFNIDHTLPYIEPIYAEHIVLGSIVVLLASYIWKLSGQDTFTNSSFLIAQAFYAVGILLSIGFVTDALVRVMIMVGGIGMAYLMYKRSKWPAIPYVISSISLVAFLSILVFIHEGTVPHLFTLYEFILGAILLLFIGFLLKQKDSKLTKAFYWIGHIYIPFALLLTLLFNGEDALWTFLITTIVYMVTVKIVSAEWQIKTFFYSGMTVLWIFLQLVFAKLDWNNEFSYTYFIVSVLLFAGWMVLKDVWKKRIFYYFLPYSILGLWSFVMSYPDDWILFGITIVYGVLILFVLHRMKWDALSIIPLLLLYSGLVNFNITVFENWMDDGPFLYALFGIIVVITGQILYRTLYQAKSKHVQIDWYTLMGLFVFLNLYQYTSFGNLFAKILPGILIVMTLLMNRKRVQGISSKWITFAAFVFLLQPYYALLGHFELPHLFEREFYVLPWIALVIGLRSFVMKENKGVANNIQWAVLVIVALLLVQDGLASNTIYDALIIGVLSLASLISGMAFQMKSFFFVGTGVLLFNVFMQTKPYWGNLPWWGYLIIAGSILIAIASYNEWQKQKSTEGKDTLVSKFKKNVLKRMKDWD